MGRSMCSLTGQDNWACFKSVVGLLEMCSLAALDKSRLKIKSQ
jgi:hypothetical protein